MDLDDPLDRNILKSLYHLSNMIRNNSSSSSNDSRGGRLHIKKRDNVPKRDTRDSRYNKDNNRRGQKQQHNNKYQNNRNSDQDTKALL